MHPGLWRELRILFWKMISFVEIGDGVRNSVTSGCQRVIKIWPFQTHQISVPDGCGARRHYFGSGTCHIKKIPFFILLISVLETVIFFAADESLKNTLLYDSANRRQLWRFLTYMFLHTNELHLGLNVVIQGFLGTPLELEQGRLRCAVIYFGGGLAGSLGTSAFTAFSLMAGASGGVYALLTAQIPNVVLNYATIKYAPHRIATVIMLTVADIGYFLFRAHFYCNATPKIGWVAHAAGAVAGIFLGFSIFQGTSKWKQKLRMVSCLVLAVCFLFKVALSFIPSSFNFFSNLAVLLLWFFK